jgi:serine/threonine protein kinase
MALAHMHACGVVHADIKPDNILLCEPPGKAQPQPTAAAPSTAPTRSAVTLPPVRLCAGCGAGLRVRLADLGSCFSCTETDTRRVGQEVQTLPYRAPEASGVVLPSAAFAPCALLLGIFFEGTARARRLADALAPPHPERRRR